MKIRLHSAAKQDLIEGYHFYENQQQTIGQYFLDSLVISAGTHQKSHKQLYRMDRIIKPLRNSAIPL